MIILLIIFGFVATGLGIWLAALTSPAGYEDEAGFHFGIQQKIPVQKGAKKIPSHVNAKVISQKKAERKNTSRPRLATAEWQSADPYSDQLKFPFPVTH